MVKPTITSDQLVLEMEGADKFLALKSRLSIALAHITEVRVDTEVVKQWFHGLKAPGTAVPHVITAGTFYQHGQRVFWDIHHPDRAVVISLRDETYNELVIQVEAPEVFVDDLSRVIGQRS